MRLYFIWIFLCCGLIGFSQKQKQRITLYFDRNLSEIKPADAENMERFFYAKHDILSVSVTGYCDDTGSSDANLKLSMSRAEAVKNYLSETFGVKANTVSGKGEIALSETASKFPERSRQFNRKVDVFIEFQDSLKITQNTTVKDTIDHYEGYKTIKDSLAPGDKIILRHILFAGGRTAFEDQEEADAELETLVDYFLKNPDIQFAVNGHVCCITKSFWDARDLDSGKNNLSETRAKKIFDYFVEKGIDPARMTHKGYGRKFPRENVAEQLNKRVEIVILKT